MSRNCTRCRIDAINCTKCKLHHYRRKIVTGRGQVPADILFIGEAPGKSEDLLGCPFVGPSGKLLESLFHEAAKDAGLVAIPSHYITNTVFCRPTDEFMGQNREPEREEVLACMPNVMRIYKRVEPKIVVFIGKVSERYYGKEFPMSSSIYHPAFLLRGGGPASPYYLQTVNKLSTIFKEVCDG